MAKINITELMQSIESCIESADVFTNGEDPSFHKIDSDNIWKNKLLIHVGLDSISFSELRIALEDKLNIILPTSFDETVKTLGDVLNALTNDAKILKEEEYNVGT